VKEVLKKYDEIIGKKIYEIGKNVDCRSFFSLILRKLCGQVIFQYFYIYDEKI